MGKIFSFLGFGGAPKAQAPAPIQVADTGIEDDKKSAKAKRRALYKTEGGAAGQELNPDQVKKRDTLFGN